VRTALCLLAVVAVTAASQRDAAPAGTTMTYGLNEAARDFKGVLGVAARDLATGEELAVNADTRFPTASTIKTAVMLEAYRQAAESGVSFSSTITLQDADKVGGSGVLRDMSAGLPVTIADLVRLMIVLSDNTATNMLIGRLGTANVDRTLDRYGLTDMRLFRPTFRDGRPDVLPELEREFGLGMTTPRMMARLMALIADGKAVSPEASAAMLATLQRQQDRAMIPRLLPEDVQVGNKTGTDEEKLAGPDGVKGHIRADAAIVTGPGGLRYVIAINTRQVRDTRWTVDNDALVTGAKVSKMVYDYFAGKHRPAAN
jgi:beta-lactamase class A